MAKATAAAAKISESTALATAASDELADILGDIKLEHDGLDELGADDIKIGVKVANFKGVDPAGDPIPANVFYDTVDETTSKVLDVTLLTFHKSNEWRTFDNTKSKTVTHCRSFDQVTGEMENGTKRPCKNCPDAEWKTGDGGKRTKNCGVVYNLIGVERLTQKPFIYRARKTAVEPLKLYLNRHFIGRRRTATGVGHYPLFAFQTRISLKMETKAGTTWALPVFERGDVQSREEILAAQESAKFYREQMLPVLAKADAHDANADVEPDTSFDTDDFANDGGSAPAATGSNHF